MNRIIIFLVLVGCLFGVPVHCLAASNPVEDVGRLMMEYYKDPRPDLVPDILNELLNSEVFTSGDIEENDSHYTSAYAFARMAQLEPSLLSEYLQIFENASDKGREFLLSVFKLCGDARVKQKLLEKSDNAVFAGIRTDLLKTVEGPFPVDFDPLTRKVEHPTDLDLLWTEFFISGNELAINKIIDTLDFPEILRPRIHQKLDEDDRGLINSKLIDLLSSELNVKIDPMTTKVLNQEDLDNLMVRELRNPRGDKDALRSLLKMLEVENADLFYMAIKGAAVWSLRSNARQHPAVMDICKNQVTSRRGRSKIVLLRILAQAVDLEDIIKSDVDVLDELVKLTPYDWKAIFLLGQVYLAIDDLELAQVQLEKLEEIDEDSYKMLLRKIEYHRLKLLSSPGDTEVDSSTELQSIIEQVVGEGGKLKSFATLTSVYSGDAAEQSIKQDLPDIQWEAEVIMPDRYSVMQTAREETGYVYDRWNTIGEDLYFQIGVWFKDESNFTGRSAENFMVSLAKWLDLLSEAVKNNLLDVTETADINYVFVRMDSVEINKILPEKYFEISGDSEVEIWIHKNARQIHKTVLYVDGVDSEGNTVRLKIVQLFTAYNSDISIEAPTEVFNLGSEKAKAAE